MPTEISKDKKKRIIKLRALDYPKTEIADKVGVSRTTVNRHLRKFRDSVESWEEVKENIENGVENQYTAGGEDG